MSDGYDFEPCMSNRYGIEERLIAYEPPTAHEKEMMQRRGMPYGETVIGNHYEGRDIAAKYLVSLRAGKLKEGELFTICDQMFSMNTLGWQAYARGVCSEIEKALREVKP